MFPLVTETPFSRDQVVAVTCVMLQVAHIDGAGTAEEVAMIHQFYDGFLSSGGDDWPEFSTLCRNFGEASVSIELFPDESQREMIISTCIMVAFADGVLTEEERSALDSLSESLGITIERFEQILALVKDHMLTQLAGLPDTESLIAVARELG